MEDSNKLLKAAKEQAESHEIRLLKNKLTEALKEQDFYKNQCYILQSKIQKPVNMLASEHEVSAPPRTTRRPAKKKAKASSSEEETVTTSGITDFLKSELTTCVTNYKRIFAECQIKTETIMCLTREITMLKTKCGHLQEQLDTTNIVKSEIEKKMNEISEAEMTSRYRIDALRTQATKLQEGVSNLYVHTCQMLGLFDIDVTAAVRHQYKILDTHIADTIDNLTQNLNYTKFEFDNMKSLYDKVCNENFVRETQLRDIRSLLKGKLLKIMSMQQKTRTDWKETAKERDELTYSQLEYQNPVTMMAFEDKLARLCEHQMNTDASINEFLTDINRLLQEDERVSQPGT